MPRLALTGNACSAVMELSPGDAVFSLLGDSSGNIFHAQSIAASRALDGISETTGQWPAYW